MMLCDPFPADLLCTTQFVADCCLEWSVEIVFLSVRALWVNPRESTCLCKSAIKALQRGKYLLSITHGFKLRALIATPEWEKMLNV